MGARAASTNSVTYEVLGKLVNWVGTTEGTCDVLGHVPATVGAHAAELHIMRAGLLNFGYLDAV